MLQLNQIHSFYGKSHVLHGVSLLMAENEIVTLLGRNGVGKTTTLKSIMGLVDVRSGSIFYKSENIVGKKPYEIFRQGLGYVPQGRRIFTSLTVAENLNLAKGEKLKQGQSKENKLEWIFNIFPVLKQRLNHGGSQLSGGEQQMLAIARVLLGRPEAILMDEPTEGLAPLMVDTILNTLLELKKIGLTVLLVEANLKMAINLGNRHYVMDQGTVACEVTTQQLMEDRELLDKYFRI
jgi:branched-chain amino acid transport system ATP-binding protein